MLNVLPQVVKLRGMALDFLFPARCLGCGREGDFFCGYCRDSLSRIISPLCPHCGQPQPDGTVCPGCLSSPGEIDGIRSPFSFDGVMRQAVYQLKYHNLRAVAAPLARLLHDYLLANPVPGDVLVPVPLHRKRLRERGYDQSGLLAGELGKLTGLEVVDDCLFRQQQTFSQARTLTVEERRSNVAGAFSCRDQRLRGKSVVLIDDVTTSGATLNAGATALKAAGAASVWGLALAREL